MHLISIFGVFVAVVVIGAIALVIALVVSRSQSPALVAHPPMGETPVQILDRRFASGEIDAEEYKRARDLIGGGGKA